MAPISIWRVSANQLEVGLLVAASLRAYGFRQPIVVDTEGVIVCDHTRWKAAQKLKLAKVPLHVAKDLTPEQIKTYRIKDKATGVRIYAVRAINRMEPVQLTGQQRKLVEQDACDMRQLFISAALLRKEPLDAEPVGAENYDSDGGLDEIPF